MRQHPFGCDVPRLNIGTGLSNFLYCSFSKLSAQVLKTGVRTVPFEAKSEPVADVHLELWLQRNYLNQIADSSHNRIENAVF